MLTIHFPCMEKKTSDIPLNSSFYRSKTVMCVLKENNGEK